MHTTQISLLERIRQPGEQQAWERFVELYTPLLYHWACHVGLQDQDAADLVQDVFTTLVQKMPEFAYDRHKSFRGWLRTVTLNTWRDNRRRRGRKPLNGNAEALDGMVGPDNGDAFWETEYRKHLIDRSLD